MSNPSKYFIEFIREDGLPELGSDAYIRLDGRLAPRTMIDLALLSLARRKAFACRIIRTASLLDDRPQVLATIRNPIKNQLAEQPKQGEQAERN